MELFRSGSQEIKRTVLISLCRFIDGCVMFFGVLSNSTFLSFINFIILGDNTCKVV